MRLSDWISDQSLSSSEAFRELDQFYIFQNVICSLFGIEGAEDLIADLEAVLK